MGAVIQGMGWGSCLSYIPIVLSFHELTVPLYQQKHLHTVLTGDRTHSTLLDSLTLYNEIISLHSTRL